MTQPLDDRQQTTDLTPAQVLRNPKETGTVFQAPCTELTRVGGTASAKDGGTNLSRPSATRAGSGLGGIPGYELLGELGRGGMGVVYKARHIKANRVVALKMILAGGHAGSAELARFQTEAQAIAALQHPHIVQVFDVGEHDGLPFFSLEFCSGGALDRKLAGTPLPPLESARLVETLARAMHAAHQAGVIHRDLKPANILLASGVSNDPGISEPGLIQDAPLADLVPKITDFGLAKKLDEAGQTAAGAIMGTPSYMAPEQASGKSDELGPACDVYALGAILYECLTGRPPFRAATPLDTIVQVVNDEPVPPAQLNARTPRDLETICLKCLQKLPGKRYTSALALADDLLRYQRGEPITARPVSRLERGWRWCRRNPAVASLLAAVVLLFVAGTTVSTLLFVLADHRADEAEEARGAAETEGEKARRNEETAMQEKAAAVAARNDLEKANADLTRSQEALLKSTDSLVTSVARRLLHPLALQIQPHEPLPPLSDPESESLWELASSKEDRLPLRFVEEALRTRMSTRQLKDRAAVALQAAVGLNETRRTQVEELLGKRLQAGATPQEQQEHVALCLAHLGIRDRPLAGRTTATLAQAMSKTTNPYALLYLSQGLSAAAARLEPKEAAVVCGQAAGNLAQAMSKTTNRYALLYLSQGLSVVAAHMVPKEATVVCGQAAGTLTQVMSKTTLPYDLQTLSQGLLAVVAWVDPKQAAFVCGQAAALLTQAMSTTTDRDAIRVLTQSLGAMAARMEPKEAAVAWGQAAATLTQALSKTTNYDTLQYLSQGLLAVVDRMEPKEAAATLTQALSQTTNHLGLHYLSQGLAAVAARMEPKEAAVVCGQGATILNQAISKTTAPIPLHSLARGLTAVAAHMEPKEGAATLTQAISKTTGPYDLRDLSQGLSAVAARMEPKEAAVTLLQVMSKMRAPEALLPLSQGVLAVAERLEPREAAGVRAQAAAVLTRAITSSIATHAMQSLTEGLAALTPGLEPKEVANAAATLTQAMRKTTNYVILLSLSQGLKAVAARMDPKEAAGVCAQAAATLTQAISKTTDPDALWHLAEGLAAVAARMEPGDAAGVCGQTAVLLAQAISKVTGPNPLYALSRGLTAVAVYMEPKQAAVVCGRAATILTQALSTQVMSTTTSHFDFQYLSERLAALGASMDPQAAAAACGQAAATLTQGMNRTTDYVVLQSLWQGLLAVAPRMDPHAAAAACGQAAATLTQALSTTARPGALPSLSQGLAAVLCRAAPLTTRQRTLSVTATLAVLPGPGASFAALARAHFALEPLPPPLPAQTLVDLLKHPLCVGEPRRLVLEQLARHYTGPFADQWEFVEYVHKQRLDLDLTTPPQRPEPAVAGSP